MKSDNRPDDALLFVAGEASGDAHAASVIREISALAPDVGVVGVGGDAMAAAGTELLQHYRGIAVVGITEVLSHLGEIRRAMNRLLDAAGRPGVRGVVLVDYPEFNMALARRLRRRHPELPIVYYISPQVWAWRSGRVSELARLVDRMLVILPFEEALYADAGVAVDFVGHPLLDETIPRESRDAVAQRYGLDPALPWLGALPGSRLKEVQRLLPDMLHGVVSMLEHGDHEIVVPRAPGVDRAVYSAAIDALPGSVRERVHLLDGAYHQVLAELRAAVVCSGTATLETALAGVPEVVVYRTSWLTYNLGKLLVRISNIALVNVVAGRRGVPELLQGDVTPANIADHLHRLSTPGSVRDECLAFLEEVRGRLGEPGASGRAAAAILATTVATEPAAS